MRIYWDISLTRTGPNPHYLIRPDVLINEFGRLFVLRLEGYLY